MAHLHRTRARYLRVRCEPWALRSSPGRRSKPAAHLMQGRSSDHVRADVDSTATVDVESCDTGRDDRLRTTPSDFGNEQRLVAAVDEDHPAVALQQERSGITPAIKHPKLCRCKEHETWLT